MKLFTVVFPVSQANETYYILLGQQPAGKPLAGFLNGYGGKVNEGEEIESAAKRELKEELGIEAKKLTSIGKVTAGEKQIYCYLITIEHKEYPDSTEMVGNTWFDLRKNDFIERMLPGDEALITFIRENIQLYFENQEIKEFTIQKEGKAISEATVELDKSLRNLK